MFSEKAWGQHKAAVGALLTSSPSETQFVKSDQQKSFRVRDVQTPDPVTRPRAGGGLGQDQGSPGLTSGKGAFCRAEGPGRQQREVGKGRQARAPVQAAPRSGCPMAPSEWGF